MFVACDFLSSELKDRPLELIAEPGFRMRNERNILNGTFKDESHLWEAYRDLTRFINFYDGAYALENEVRRLKKWRDEHFTNAIAIVEKVKLGLIKLPEQ